MNQKDAVFEAIKQIKPNEVDKDAPVKLSKQEKAVVQQKLFDGFRRGRIQYNHEKPSDDKLQLYVSGLVSNWLRKDRRLNGHTTYHPQRPSARGGSLASVGGAVNTPLNPNELDAIQQLAGNAGPGEEVRVYVVRRRPQEAGDVESALGDY